MTTIRQIVNRAFREGNIIEVGETPEQDEFAEGLWKLKNFISSLFGYEAGEQFETVSLNEGLYNNTYVPENSLLILDNESNLEIKLPPTPTDGARISVLKRDADLDTVSLTLDANGRTIEGDSTKSFTDDVYVGKQWFYRADLGDWVLVSELDENSTSPFPPEFDDFLILSLAVRLNPAYEARSAPETLEFLRQQRAKFKSRYRQNKEIRHPLYYFGVNQFGDFTTGRMI